MRRFIHLSMLSLLIGMMHFLIASCSTEAEDLSGNISGKVTDAQTGEVIQGVSITLSPGGLSRTTGSDGTYEFFGIEAQSYTVQAQKVDYVTNTKSVNLYAGQTAIGDMVLTPVKKLELSATMLNFGKTNNSLSFDVLNKGTGRFNWNISGTSAANWIEVTPASGALDGGKSATVQVNILRDKLTENTELTLMVNADKESASIKVTVEVEKKTAKLELSTTKLDFGTEEGVLTFDVKNVGNTTTDWKITGLDVDWITISPMEGTLDPDKTQAVKVSLARALVKDHVKTVVMMNAAGESIPIEIMADEKKVRYITADPAVVDFGGNLETATLTLCSYYGSTTYMLLKKEEGENWLTLKKTSGTIPQYDAANPSMKENIEMVVSRNGMTAGNYQCTLIVRSDLEDLEIPVRMTVEESATKLQVAPVNIDLGQEQDAATFTVKHIGNSSTLQWKIGAIDVDWFTLSSTEGTLAIGGSATINVILDRTKLKGKQSKSFMVEAGEESVQVTVSAEEKALPVAEGSIISCDENLQFTLVSCKMSGSTANIAYKVKNIGKNTINLYLEASYGGDKSFGYDDRGNEYLFNDNASFLELGASKSTGSVSINLPADIETDGRISFSNIDEAAAFFTYVQLRARVDNGSYTSLVLKNVKIEGRTASSLPAAQTTGEVVSCHENLHFTIVDCKRVNGNVKLSFRVKNTGTGQFFSIEGSYGGSNSYAFDDKGTEYPSSTLTLTLGGYESSGGVTAPLPTQVEVNGTLTVKSVNTEATQLKNVTLRTRVGNDSYTQLVFKNIKIN